MHICISGRLAPNKRCCKREPDPIVAAMPAMIPSAIGARLCLTIIVLTFRVLPGSFASVIKNWTSWGVHFPESFLFS